MSRTTRGDKKTGSTGTDTSCNIKDVGLNGFAVGVRGSASGTRPFAYEISIATHLMHKGWDVEFIDYSGAARFDLLACSFGKTLR